MSPSAFGARMSRMPCAFIHNFNPYRLKHGKLLSDQFSVSSALLYGGKTFLNGLTITFANTPEVA